MKVYNCTLYNITILRTMRQKRVPTCNTAVLQKKVFGHQR